MIEIAGKYSQIVRQNGNGSQQPRFAQVNPQRFFNSLFRFREADIYNEPDYGEPQRDAWLRKVWPKEPYLSGVINSVVSIDKNRGWSLTGGRNQVARFVNVLHNRYFMYPDLYGWRAGFGGAALSYYTSDLGSITEIGRQGNETGPLDSLYFVDPARCRLTGDFEQPLRYFPDGGKEQLWGRDDYFRVASMPNTNESYYGLGFCALSRCLELAKIMIGIYQYDNEMLLNRAPRGLLLLKGITQDQWEDAMTARTARLDGDEKQYYGAINVLAALDPGVEIEAQLVALSQLPAEFDQETFTNLLMYGYALAFGYDVREFWPVSAGALGTATETEAQHRKAGAKGGLDFTLGFAERLQEELPDSLLFEFEERDLDGELANAVVQQAQADVIMTMYEKGMGIITQEQAMILAAQQGLIDPEWTVNEEDTVATDTEGDISREQIQRAAYEFPNEPIVKYTSRIVKGREINTYQTLHVPYRRSFQVVRQIEEIETYQEELEALSDLALNGEITQEEYEEQLIALTAAILLYALLRDNDNEAATALKETALLVIDDPTIGNEILLNELSEDSNILNEATTAAGIALLLDEIRNSELSTLPADIYAGNYEDNREGLLSRLAMWGITAEGVYQFGKIINKPQAKFVWLYGDTQHCDDCARLNGQVHTGEEWQRSGWRPRSRSLSCKGYRCQCRLDETTAAISGGF